MLLDASVVLAFLTNEPGTQAVRAALLQYRCVVSSVTLAEVEGKLVGRGEFTSGQVGQQYAKLLSVVRELPFDSACREKAAFYYARKSPYDLSLGDACCLGTAEALEMDVLTAERGWAVIPDLPFKVQLTR
ncbi:PIN domain-containing protein [Deinococcus arenicola]|uniref:PIN domain-containing protein n=1 Tax=Deinococcus arenicola TaxID=2994950 RepID=A0ABU4DRK4_9DEIO|nr:PIN domain-containing protein [Deinococcus sp. ZS9-10]MDV6375071.1 PIN domain-containing protein [Deinococcus sp. ZS9-10]